MKVVVDQSRCVGAGQCVLVAPEVFDQRDEDGIVVLLQENPPAELQAQAKEAAQLCPALAIEVDG
ncbi:MULTISPECIES: ferredoxin [Amycolatopsis]|uniref:ferredoxin n=1 Tax=Amycolatopsis TaxID=1813 RepID=UPI0003A56BA9|nr:MULTISPECIES: ferredoxin [Amycolatopsis]MCG3757307.1 ferredoxin [Amycolatopsis sp. Poz14]